MKQGLKERIENAQTSKEVNGLLKEGEGFKEAFIAGRDKYRSSNRTHCHATFHHYAPRLIGQKSGHLTKALQQFREGQRRAPMMANLLKSWSSTEYENVVTYSVGYVECGRVAVVPDADSTSTNANGAPGLFGARQLAVKHHQCLKL